MPADFKADFLGGAAALAPFFRWGTAAPDWAGAAAARAQHDPATRGAVVADLHAQYAEAGLTPGPAVAASLEALSAADTLTVVTGQQPGLMGGPLYTLYKTVGAIALARWLTARLGRRVVPVFWMASEDHDWAEVNAAGLSWTDTARYPAEWSGAVGRLVLDARADALATVHPRVAAAYTPGRTWAQAFAALWHGLFAEHGLIVMDADRPALKRLALPLWADELGERRSLAALEQQTAALAAAGYAPQIQGRAVNLFYLSEAGRHRIVYTNGTYGAEGHARQWNRAEVLAELHVAPERFSPNVVLRPVYQEWLLPNVAYLGGWAEVQYWAQLGGVFAQAGVPYPVVLPRPQALVLPAERWAAWQALGLGPAELQLAPHTLRRQLVAPHLRTATGQALPELRQASAGVAQAYGALAEALEPVDGGQARNARGQAHRAERFFDRLEQKLGDRLARRHPEWWQPALDLQAQLQPYGTVQERTLAWPAVTAAPEALIAQLLARVEAPEQFGRLGAPLLI